MMKNLSKISFLFSLVAITIIYVNNVFAATISHVADYKYWSVFKTSTGVKYAVSFPIKDEGTYLKRERPYLMVSNFNGKAEVSINVGYHQKKPSKAEVLIYLDRNNAAKKESYSLLTSKEFSWNEKDEEDYRMVASMKKGDKIVINAASTRSTYSIDTYSLEGFTSAYGEIMK